MSKRFSCGEIKNMKLVFKYTVSALQPKTIKK